MTRSAARPSVEDVLTCHAWPVPSTILRSCWRRPDGSRRRLGSGWPGCTPDGSTRRVSLHDPDARPIAKGRLGKPVEFGHKPQVVDNDDGVVLDHDVQPGNPAKRPAWSRRHRLIAVAGGTSHRGHGARLWRHGVDAACTTSASASSSSPQADPPNARQAEEHRRASRRHLKWRTGCEGRISTLKPAMDGIAAGSTPPKAQGSGSDILIVAL